MAEKPVSRDKPWRAINGSHRPQRRRDPTSVARERNRENRQSKARTGGSERARVEKGRAGGARCMFRRNMGLFPFATRFARPSQLAFVASPATNNPSPPPLLLPSLSPRRACIYLPFSSRIRAIIEMIVFTRRPCCEIISEITPFLDSTRFPRRRLKLFFDNIF